MDWEISDLFFDTYNNKGIEGKRFTGLNNLASLASMYLGYKQYQLAKDNATYQRMDSDRRYALEKQAYDTNLISQKKAEDNINNAYSLAYSTVGKKRKDDDTTLGYLVKNNVPIIN